MISSTTRINNAIAGEFYALQRQELMEMYQEKLIKATAYVHLALRCENPFVDRPIKLKVEKFAKKWKIARSNVYRAIAALKEKKAIDIVRGEFTLFFLPPDSQKQENVSDVGINSQELESIPKNDSEFSDVGINSQELENENPEHQTEKDLQHRVRETLQTDPNSSQTLSGAERVEKKLTNSDSQEDAPNNGEIEQPIDSDWEQFIDRHPEIPKDHRSSFVSFCKLEADKLPKAPRLVISWASKHFNELFCLYRQQYGLDPHGAAVTHKKHEERQEPLPESIFKAIETGEIKAVDRAQKMVMPNVEGIGWMTYEDWIATNSTPGGFDRILQKRSALRQKINKPFKGFGKSIDRKK